MLYATKKTQLPKCGDCKCELRGIPAVRPKMMASLSKRVKTVSRAYGGKNYHWNEDEIVLAHITCRFSQFYICSIFKIKSMVFKIRRIILKIGGHRKLI